MCLSTNGSGRDFLEIVVFYGAGTASLHLLEVIGAFHVTHKQQALKRFDVGARCDHVHCHGDAWIVFIAELGENGFRILFGLIGDLLTELVFFSKFFSHCLDDIVGMAVGLGKDKRLRHFSSTGEYILQIFVEGVNYCANLIGIDDVAVELFGGI